MQMKETVGQVANKYCKRLYSKCIPLQLTEGFTTGMKEVNRGKGNIEYFS